MFRVILSALMMVLASTALAAAQPPQPGNYELDWAILHSPVSSDLPTLETGTSSITLQDAKTAPGACTPNSAFVVFNAPASQVMGGTTTWCILPDGTFDGAATGSGNGFWNQYTSTHAMIEAEQGSKANDRVMAVARLQESPPPPPPPSTLKVVITQPRAGATVSGTVWVVIWVEGASGSSNVFTLKVDGADVATQNAGSSKGPVSIPWRTTSAANGTHTITASVRDATGATGSTSVSVIVNNP